MVAPDNVVVVPEIVVGVGKAASVDFSQRTTDPVFPLKIRSAGELPEQIVWADAIAPPTDVGFMVTVWEAVTGPPQPAALTVMVLVPLQPAA